jgi:uncharacterized protein (TIGR03000 family)
MIRKRFSFGGLLFLAVAAVLVLPASGWAQHAGGHFGGPSFGGASFGPGHVGGIGVGGLNHGYYHGSYSYGYPRLSYGPYPFAPNYAAYGYVGRGFAFRGSYYSSGGDVLPYIGKHAPVMPPAEDDESYFPGGTAGTDNRATITVHVPADARVWFDGAATNFTGPVREFHSPALKTAQWYTYEIKATWKENGREMTQTQQVEVTPGARVNADFPLRPRAAATMASPK